MKIRNPKSMPFALLVVLIGITGTVGDVIARDTGTSVPDDAKGRAADWQATLDLQRWASGAFHADYNDAVLKMMSAHGKERETVLLNAAELYLSHMLLYEALSVLSRMEPQNGKNRDRHIALRDAANLLMGKAVENTGSSPLFQSDRPDSAFWFSLQAIATADIVMLSKNVRQSFAGLGLQSKAVLRAMLPVFTEAVIETEDSLNADAALRLMKELPDLYDSPTGFYLQGRAEQKRGNESSALQAFFEAAEGWDQYAARARLSIADMSLGNGSRGALLAAQSTLEDGAEAWRGGRYELEILRRLIRVYQATDNHVEGLMGFGKLLARYPGTPEAERAKGEAYALLERFYQKGANGNFALADWMSVHLRLIPLFRGAPSFAKHTETLADYLLELGATDLASQEFRRAIRLAEENSLADSSDNKGLFFRLNLKLAKAQFQGGLLEDAQVTLGLMDQEAQPGDREEFAQLNALVLASVGDRKGLLETRLREPTPDYLRDLARALAAEERWAQSIDVMKRLWSRFPQDFDFEDATLLLIAANRAQDADMKAEVVRAFPSLTNSEPLVELAKSIDDTLPDLLPLTSMQANERLTNVESAFQSIKDSRIYP